MNNLENSSILNFCQDKDILLTIGIPVYNGENSIAITIKSIFAALEFLKEKYLIEVIVSDNKSIDKTSEIINEFIRCGYMIKYYYNEKNLGYDANIDLIVKRGSGKYVWFLGCGEKIKKDALSRIVEILDSDIEYTNLLLDYDTYDEATSKIISNKVHDFKSNKLLIGKEDFRFKRYDLAVSSNIINREFWFKVISKPLIVAGWCHIERILWMISLNHDCKTLIAIKPFYTLFKERNGWWTKLNSYKLHVSLIKVIENMYTFGYTKNVINIEKKRYTRKYLIRVIISYKNYGNAVSKEMIYSFKEFLRDDYFFWLVILPLLLLPKKLIFIPEITLKILSYIKKALKSVKKNNY